MKTKIFTLLTCSMLFVAVNGFCNEGEEREETTKEGLQLTCGECGGSNRDETGDRNEKYLLVSNENDAKNEQDSNDNNEQTSLVVNDSDEKDGNLASVEEKLV